MVIHAKSLIGHYLTLGVEPTDRIKDLMARIRKVVEYPGGGIRLVYAGRQLGVGLTLEECGIPNGATINVAYWPRGWTGGSD
jgi:hypothetical protein